MEEIQTDHPARGQRSPWRMMAHLLAFGLLAALAILLAKGPPGDERDPTRITLTTADLAQVHATFERTWSRPPTAVELQNAFERYVRSEVLYREALARGLDRNNPVVQMSLVRKITMLGTAQAQAAEPTDAELQAYFELRAERYRVPASLSLRQVYLNPDERSDNLGTDAAQLLAILRDRNPEPEELDRLGDVSMLPTTATEASEDELARTFGADFRETVVSLPVGEWLGPVESGYGLHLVRISHREESRIPEWVEVRDRIASDLLYEAAKAAEDQFYAEVLPRYQVVYDDGVIATLEGRGARGPDAGGG